LSATPGCAVKVSAYLQQYAWREQFDGGRGIGKSTCIHLVPEPASGQNRFTLLRWQRSHHCFIYPSRLSTPQPPHLRQRRRPSLESSPTRTPRRRARLRPFWRRRTRSRFSVIFILQSPKTPKAQQPGNGLATTKCLH